MAEELLPIFMAIFFTFIGLLITFILGVFGFHSKLIEVIKSLTKIEEHTSRITGLEDKMIELRLTLEKGRLSSVPFELPKTKLELVVKVEDKSEETTRFTITPRLPTAFPRRVIDKSLVKWGATAPGVRKVAYSTYEIDLEIATTDARKAAKAIKAFLNIFDAEWFKQRHWEENFKAEMTEGK